MFTCRCVIAVLNVHWGPFQRRVIPRAHLGLRALVRVIWNPMTPRPAPDPLVARTAPAPNHRDLAEKTRRAPLTGAASPPPAGPRPPRCPHAATRARADASQRAGVIAAAASVPASLVPSLRPRSAVDQGVITGLSSALDYALTAVAHDVVLRLSRAVGRRSRRCGVCDRGGAGGGRGVASAP